MLRHRVIPLVLLDGYSVIKTIGFNVRRNLGNPVTVCRIYNMRNVDELIILDIDATKQNRAIDLGTIRVLSKECFMPLTVGGGLSTIEHISKTLQAGADKVVLNSIIFKDSHFLNEAVQIFGSQCIVASIDVKRNENGKYEVFSHAGCDVCYSLDEYLDFVLQAKVGEILINNVDLDGSMQGYDQQLIAYVAERVKSIPVIFSGGAASPSDCSQAIKSGATAVAVASIFHFTSTTPQSCCEDMAKEGIPVRLIS